LNLFVDDGDRSKLAKLVTLGPMISQLRLNGDENFDCLGEGNANFSTCHDLDLSSCKFTNKEKFEDFLVSLESSLFLTRLRLWRLEFEEKAVINQRLVDIMRSSPI